MTILIDLLLHSFLRAYWKMQLRCFAHSVQSVSVTKLTECELTITIADQPHAHPTPQLSLSFSLPLIIKHHEISSREKEEDGIHIRRETR